MAKHVTDADFQTEVLDNDKVVLVDFWADWCGPCHMLAPTFEELAEEMDDVDFMKLNVDENRETAAKYQVMSIPTVIVFKNGEEVERLIGVQPKEAYVQAIEKHK